MSVASEITRLQNAKEDIKSAIEAKGVEIPSNATLDTFDSYIEDIPSGGTDTRWQEIGYTEEPESIQDGINYAKEIMQNWDASITDRSNAFKNDYQLKYFPSVDTSNITSASYMFGNCYKLESIDFDTSSLYNANNMFRYCYSLCKINNFDFSPIFNAQYMFYQCTGLIEVGDLNFANADLRNLFQGCVSLKKIKSINITRNGNNNTEIFSGCTNLETIGAINTTLTNFDHTTYIRLFENCPNLSNATLKVILNFLKQLTSQSSSRKTLLTFGLSQTQAELCTTFDEWEDLEEAGWTTGY